jgi:hypothetical protein
MKISLCVGRSAPPDSVRDDGGQPVLAMISLVRRFFFSVYGLLAPPRMVGSLPVIMHSTPSTTPMPARFEANASERVSTCERRTGATNLTLTSS